MTKRKPEWLKISLGSGKDISYVENLIKDYNLNTVCKAANCPNRLECYSNRTATFMIMGDTCTRNCRFCNVTTGSPIKLNAEEPRHIREAVEVLKLKYAVITSVTRDDLTDGGAEHFVKVVQELKSIEYGVKIELLIPDFGGNTSNLERVIESKPDVLNHNMETVSSLYSEVRPGASYDRSLNILKYVKETSKIITKTGIMLGLGEKDDEVKSLLNDLISVGCDLLTIGQYCQPTKKHLEVKEYVKPEKFNYWESYALNLGFRGVSAGPFVRSSYSADKLLKEMGV